jgi:hypothetical protein
MVEEPGAARKRVQQIIVIPRRIGGRRFRMPPAKGPFLIGGVVMVRS